MPVRDALTGGDVFLGAQNMYHEASGAFTGEMSAAMLKDVGCTYVILGHSERRHILGETDDDVNKKTLAAHAAGLTPIVCVGEKLDEREAGQTADVIRTQFDGSLAGLSPAPDGGDRHRLRAGLGHRHGQSRHARSRPRRCMPTFASCSPTATMPRRPRPVRILYGGSVKPDNAAELLKPAEYRRRAGRRGVPEGGRLSGDRRGRHPARSGRRGPTAGPLTVAATRLDLAAELAPRRKRRNSMSPCAQQFEGVLNVTFPVVLAFGQALFGLLLTVMAIFLILLVLVQRGRGGGLAGALGGMGGSSAFGAKAGDVFTRITIVAAAIWIVLCIAASRWGGGQQPDQRSGAERTVGGRRLGQPAARP